MSDLLNDIADALTRDYQMKLSPSRLHLRQGVCPQCGKKSLWTYAATPWVVRCERANNCGYEAHAKELYPDFFESWTERYQKPEESKPEAERNPHAAADAYLQHARGFDLSLIKGLYTQETYHDAKADHGKGATSATVRFEVANTWWQRLIDKPGRFGSKKATFKFGGSYGGWWWSMPSLTFNAPAPDAPADAPQPPAELWLVEGIFDAIALAHHGIAAVSLMSCNNYPEHALAALQVQIQRQGGQVKRPVLVWALDTGRAGETYTVKHVRRARADGWECKAAQPPSGKTKVDWNDLHQRGQLDEEHRAEYLYQGALLIAATAKEKALLMYSHTGRSEFHVVHAQQWYWFKLDLARYIKVSDQIEQDIEDGKREPMDKDAIRDAALSESHTLAQICNCNPQALYYQKNEITAEAWYYFRVSFPSDRPPVKGPLTAGQLTSSAEFEKQLLHMANGAMYSGSGPQLKHILRSLMANLMEVQTIDFVGYSAKHSTYVLGDIAVHQGEVFEANADDYFEIGRTSLKTLQKSIRLDLNTDPATYDRAWLGHLWAAYGAKGLVALAYWLGALFAEQIRAEMESWPFLEVVGAPGAGKTTLIKFLWKLLGRDYEGFDPNKSTSAGRLRTFSQVSNLPIVLIESDRESKTGPTPHVRGFDWDELKDTYNGNPIRTTGVKTGGNETYDPPFRASIVISQNNPVEASQAVMERICHLFFTTDGHTADGLAHGTYLEKADVRAVSGFAVEALKREADVMAVITEQAAAEAKWLMETEGVHKFRIAKTHGQLLALLTALRRVVRLTDEQVAAARTQIALMARERMASITADPPIVALFWESFDYIDAMGRVTSTGTDTSRPRLNHHRDPDCIAVNLNEYVEQAALHRQQVPALGELKKALKSSKTRRFLEIKTVNSALNERSVHCWVFERPKHKRRTT